MTDVVFVADAFKEQFLGGAELNDDNFINFIKSENSLADKINCRDLTVDVLEQNKDKAFVISNFASLPLMSVAYLSDNCNYFIYEHDYKFLKSRNPINFVNFQAPQEHIINFDFYKNAQKIICLGKLHREIFEKNLKLKNIINIRCSLFSDEQLTALSSLNKQEKSFENAIINSSDPRKMRAQTESFCKKMGIEYELISDPDNFKFLEKMSKFKNIYFMTGHPEPTPRIAVEARALGCNFISQKMLIGVSYEDWWQLSGDDLIEELTNIREESFEIFRKLIL